MIYSLFLFIFLFIFVHFLILDLDGTLHQNFYNHDLLALSFHISFYFCIFFNFRFTPALRDGDVELWRVMCWCGGPAQVGQWGQLDECGSSESNICGTLGEISQ